MTLHQAHIILGEFGRDPERAFQAGGAAWSAFERAWRATHDRSERLVRVLICGKPAWEVHGPEEV